MVAEDLADDNADIQEPWKRIHANYWIVSWSCYEATLTQITPKDKPAMNLNILVMNTMLIFMKW